MFGTAQKFYSIWLLIFLFSGWAEAQNDTLAKPKKDTGNSFEITTEENPEKQNYLSLGGAVRFNAYYKNWKGQEANRKKYGDLDFDTWRISAKGSFNKVIFSTQYRFYPGYHFFHHGWIGYEFSPYSKIALGLTKVPFGILPYASNNWFEMMPYYIGLEDDYDNGLKWIYDKEPWDIRLGFFKNSEGGFTGQSLASSRYSYDVLGQNEEVNQGNVRVAYTFANTEIGISGQYGQLYNDQTQDFGYHYGLSAHAEGNYGPINIKLEAIQFHYNPDNTVNDEPFVLMGAYDFPYQVAKKGRMYVGGISYKLPVSWDPISALTFYNDFTFLIRLIKITGIQR